MNWRDNFIRVTGDLITKDDRISQSVTLGYETVS